MCVHAARCVPRPVRLCTFLADRLCITLSSRLLAYTRAGLHKFAYMLHSMINTHDASACGQALVPVNELTKVHHARRSSWYKVPLWGW